MEENGDAAIAGVLAIVTVLMLLWIIWIEVRDSRRGGVQPKRYAPPPATPKLVRNSGIGNLRVNIQSVVPKETGAMTKYLERNPMTTKKLKDLSLSDVGKRVRYEAFDSSVYEGSLETIEIEWDYTAGPRLSGETEVYWTPGRVVLRIGSAKVKLNPQFNPEIKFLDD